MHTSPVRQFSPFFFFFASIAIAIAVALPAIPAIPVIPQAPDLGPHPTIKAQPSEVPTTCTHEICRLGDKVAIVESQKGIDFFSFCHDFIQPNAVPRYAAQHSHCEVCPPIVVKAMKACDDLDRFVATVKRYPSGLPLEKRNTATRKPEADEILTGLVWPPLSMPPIISASVSSTSKVTSLPKRWPVQQTAAKSNSVISIPATTTTRSKTTMAKHITARMNFTVTSVVPESTVSRSRTVSAFSVSTLEEAATKRTSPSPVTMITLTTTTTETMVPQKSSAFVIHTSIMILTMTKTSTARSDEVSSALNPAPSTKIKVDSDPFSKECPMKQEISNPSFEYGWNPGNLFSDPWRYTQDCVIYFDSDRSYLGDHYLDMLGNRDQPSHISQNLTNLTVGSLYYLEYHYAVRQIQPPGSSCVLSVTFGENLVSSVSLKDTGEGQYGPYRSGARQLHFTTPTAEMKLSVTCESKTTQLQVSLDDITLKTTFGTCPLE